MDQCRPENSRRKGADKPGPPASILMVVCFATIAVVGQTVLSHHRALAQGVIGGGLNGIGGGIGSGLSIPMPAPILAGIPNGQGVKPVHISGRVLAGDEPLPRTGEIVRLVINKSIVPMVLDKRPEEDDLSLNRRDEVSRELFRSLTTKQVRVIAEQWMLARIEGQTDATDRLRIEGTIRNPADPILEIDSVRRSH